MIFGGEEIDDDENHRLKSVPHLKTGSYLANEVSLRGRCVSSIVDSMKSTPEGRVCLGVGLPNPQICND